MPSINDVDPPVRHAARRDALVVVGLAAFVGFLAAHFELSERLYALTRHGEHFQLDEWPIIAFALALGLVWFSIRRYLLARNELRARQRAEVHLAEALAENRQLAQQHVRLHESTQKHLARELHDELGQYTNAIKLDAVTIQRNPACSCAACMPAATRIVDAVDHMHAVVSDIVRRLRPAGLDELGLVAALEQCVAHWRQRMPDTSILLAVDGDFDELGELRTLTLYRLVQEALTNVSRHSAARRLEVRMTRSRRGPSDQIGVEIVDDGGPGALPYRPGFGLSSMRERVEMLGGAFIAGPLAQGGFSVAATLPTQESA